MQRRASRDCRGPHDCYERPLRGGVADSVPGSSIRTGEIWDTPLWESLVEELVAAVRQYAVEVNVACETFDPGQMDLSPRTDGTVFAPANRWTIMMWPEHSNSHSLPLCGALSE